MAPISKPLLSKKVMTKDPKERRRRWLSFATFSLVSLILFWWFLDTRLKTTSPAYENYLKASFDDADLPESWSGDAEVRFDGQSGYLYFGGLGKTLSTPTLDIHSSYRVSFVVHVLNVASTETYNGAIPTFALSSHNSQGQTLATFRYSPTRVGETLEGTFTNTQNVSYFTLAMTSFANFNGYQAYVGIDDFTLQIPKEGTR